MWALLVAVAAAGAFAAVARSGGAGSGAGWTCTVDHVTNRVTVFDNSSGGTVENGATAPTFSTNGKAYCVVLVQTYHWNGGNGALPGTLGLKRIGGAGPDGVGSLGPYKASASSGQNNAPNVNWYVYAQPPGASPQVIDGTYTCEDSGAATWSTTSKGGPGFCKVYGLPAAPVAGTGTTTATTTTTTGCPKTGPLPAQCLYDLAVRVNGPSFWPTGVNYHPEKTNTLEVRVTVSNRRNVASPALPSTRQAGLLFGPAVLKFKHKYGSENPIGYLPIELPPGCIVAPHHSIVCPVEAIAPTHHQTFIFKLVWSDHDEAEFGGDLIRQRAGLLKDPLGVFVEAVVNVSLCLDEEITCANNTTVEDVYPSG